MQTTQVSKAQMTSLQSGSILSCVVSLSVASPSSADIWASDSLKWLRGHWCLTPKSVPVGICTKSVCKGIGIEGMRRTQYNLRSGSTKEPSLLVSQHGFGKFQHQVAQSPAAVSSHGCVPGKRPEIQMDANVTLSCMVHGSSFACNTHWCITMSVYVRFIAQSCGSLGMTVTPCCSAQRCRTCQYQTRSWFNIAQPQGCKAFQNVVGVATFRIARSCYNWIFGFVCWCRYTKVSSIHLWSSSSFGFGNLQDMRIR